MATIKSTVQEYHRFLGPRIRNAVQTLTLKAKKERNGICEHCGNKAELESAHVHGMGRKDIIEGVLTEYLKDGFVVGDLEEIEQKILKKHYPIEVIFKFLCRSCHVAYDSVDQKIISPHPPVQIRRTITKSAGNTSDFKKISRIKLWANRENQDNHKMIKAFLELQKEGKVTLDRLKSKCSSRIQRPNLFIEKFDGHFASMKTDKGNSHGKVFYEEFGFVKIYPKVMEEIDKYF